MHEEALKLDGKRVAKTKKIRAKRPTEYWLLFLKTYVLPHSAPRFKFKPGCLVFLIPIIALLIFFSVDADPDTIVPVLFVSVFVSFILFAIIGHLKKEAFVPVDAFQDFAKFIIAIKGDIHKNLINLRLDYSTIENDKNLLDPYKIGLKKIKGVKYKPYSLERFHAQFILKDGSVCTTALNQISLKVTTTKRRSSGKVKTKSKHKHKLFYALTLKLNAKDYNISTKEQISKISNKKYNVMVNTANGFHFIKIKYKKKTSVISPVLRPQFKHSNSVITEMMAYISKHRIMVSKLKLK